MNIREINKSELQKLLDLYRYLHNEVPATVSQAAVAWEEIQRSSHIQYFGVFDEKELIASCNITLIPNITRGCKPYGVIENVVTKRNRRRSGYGKALLKYALEVAWGKGCYKVMLMTGRLDEETFAFYESAGFDRHGKQAFIAKPD